MVVLKNYIIYIYIIFEYLDHLGDTLIRFCLGFDHLVMTAVKDLLRSSAPPRSQRAGPLTALILIAPIR